MYSNVYPYFTKGRILKRSMLESLRDYPRQFTELYFKDYADGVISGTDVRIEDEWLVVTGGIVKHRGWIYLLQDECRVPYRATGRDTLLKIRFQDPEEQPDFQHYGAALVLDDEVQVGGNELELGRFKLKEGAKLRSAYQSFADFATEYNTWNLLHVQYAGRGGSSLHPAVTRFYAAQLLEKGSTNAYDIAFAMQCMNQGAVDRELVLHYISQRLGMGYKPYDHVQIHRYLVRILDEAQGGSRRVPDSRPHGPRRMVVD
ncbi:DNA and RNA helicase [Paenibacillus rigui]|uniref:DNA and RNA helicase n=1 Tax=Paenibacillus rigui TaxID=554312 RepID=A0A229UQ25_9BACL|nr:DNA and RNA helicase [Paenibacillus rigui]OXM85381.1 DNA and RNA helicase [Paenibacillus rigui]